MLSTAVELWQEECGAALHANNFMSLRATFDAWQLATLAAQEGRRQAMLVHAADAHRERWLQAAGLSGFVQAAADSHETARVRRLQRRMFAEWRLLAAGSQRHWEYQAARHQRTHALLRLAFAAWRTAEEETSELLARFWLRWQVHALLRRALLGWRAAASVIRQREQAQALAATHVRAMLGRRALSAWQQGVMQLRKVRLAQGMADVHHERRLLAAGMAALRSSAARSNSGGAAATALTAASSRTTSTMVVMHGHTLLPRQKQLERRPGSSITPPHQPAACLASDLVQAMETWQQQAEHWRQRQKAYIAAASCPQP